MQYLFTPPDVNVVPVKDSDSKFPVRRVYCVGRNYADHALEMGADPTREQPFFFAKPADAIVAATNNAVIALDYPSETSNFHYEVELVVGIGKAGKYITVADAKDHIWGYAIGLDMTRRDLQQDMRKGGKPWEIGKAFDRSAPISAMVPAAHAGDIDNAAIALAVNGVSKQSSSITKLIWSVPEIISYLSRFFELQPGDLIFTGTPEGIGPVVSGDTMHASIDGLGTLEAKIN